LSEVYEAAVSTVREANPQLVDKMTRSAGFVSLVIAHYQTVLHNCSSLSSSACT